MLQFADNQDSMRTLDSKTRAVTEWPRLRSIREVRGVLGPMCHYGEYTGHYAHIALPLYRMCKMSPKAQLCSNNSGPQLNSVGTSRLVWNGQAEAYVEKLNDIIGKPPVLVYQGKGVSMCHILMPANMQSEQYYQRSDKMEGPESLPCGAAIFRVQRCDTLHTTGNS